MKKIIIITLILCFNSFAKEYEFAMVEKLAIQKIGKEIVTSIYNELGISIKVSVYPGKRASQVASENLVDGEIMRAFLYADSSPNLIRVPTSIYSLVNTAYYRNDRGIVINSKKDFAKYRVGIIRGIKATEILAKGAKTIEDVPKIEQLFEMLFLDRVDVILTNTLVARTILNSSNYQNIVSNENIIQELHFHHYISKEKSELVEKVNNKIIELKQNGKLDKIITRAEIIVLSE